MQSETFEKDKLIELHISGSGSLSVYPIKDTLERRKRIEEKVAKQKAEMQPEINSKNFICMEFNTYKTV